MRKSHLVFPIDEVQQFSILFKEYRIRFILFAKSYLKDEEVAEDIVMDVLMNYWEKRHEIPHVNNVYSYILTMIKNRSINHLEHQRTVSQTKDKLTQHGQRELDFRITSLQACDPEELFSEEIMTILQNTLQSFSEQTQTVFTMSRMEGKSNKEIAELLGISSKAVEFHITKVLKKLRVELKDYLPFLLFLLRHIQ